MSRTPAALPRCYVLSLIVHIIAYRRQRAG
jgi:hypothetical protein